MNKTVFAILKKIIASLLVMNLSMIFLINSVVIAAPDDISIEENITVEEARERLADFAIDFYTKHGNVPGANPPHNHCLYNWETNGSGIEIIPGKCNREVEITCKGGSEPTDEYLSMNGYENGYRYRFDCTGFVGCMINWSLGFNGSYFPVDSGGHIHDNRFNGISIDQTSLQKGDILYTSFNSRPHVAIYVGKIGMSNQEMMIDMGHYGVQCREYNSLESYGYHWGGVARLVSLDGSNFPEIPNTPNIDNNHSGGGGMHRGEINLDDHNFKFNGMPTDVVNAGTKSFKYYLDKIADAFDYLLGIILNGFKVVPLGIVTGVNELITDSLNSLSSKIETTDENNSAEQGNESGEEQQGEEYNKKSFYTIEDLVFNKIPILDPNVFSNEPGGVQIENSSAMYKIRQAIATWYTSFRNLSIIALSIIIIYIGISMAIATTASAKANYKGMIINWIIALLIVCCINYIMILALNANDTLVGILTQQNELSDASMYETMETRAWDLRMSVGFPAAVIYVVLFIYFVKFLWIYIKRALTIMILIAIAPLVGIKYAIESSSKGKKTKVFTTWLNEFIMNVLLQSMHALIYVTIMPVAVELSTKSVFGYIIGMVFINFILQADKIFMNIFNFGKSKMAGHNAEPMKKPSEQFASAALAVGVGKEALDTAKDIATWGGRKIKKAGRVTYRTLVSKESRDKNKDRMNKIHDKYDSAVNKVYKVATGEDSNYRVLSIMSRQKGSTGRAAKKQLRKAKSSRSKKFKAPFKFIKSASGNALKIAFGVPMMVVNPGAGAGMIMNGVTGNIKMSTAPDDKGNKYKGKEAVAQYMTLGVYGTQKEIDKSEQKVDKAVTYLKEANNIEEEIRRDFKDIFGSKDTKEAKKYKSQITYILTYAEKNNIHMLLRERLGKQNIYDINDKNIDKVTDSMIEDISKQIGLDDQYTEDQVRDIKKMMKEKSKDIYDDIQLKKKQTSTTSQTTYGFADANGTDTTKEFGVEDMAKGFADAILEKGITVETKEKGSIDKYKKLTEQFMNLHELNIKAQKDIKSPVVKETQFIKSLNRKKGSTDSENRFI